MTAEAIIDDVLRRELHPSERSWAEARARKHAADRGGWTRGGITAESWGRYRGWERPATREELDAITDAQARGFYRARHVEPFDGYPDPLRLMLIDFGVTTSHGNVLRQLQRALASLGLYGGAIDGIVGPMTRAAIDRADARALFIAALDQRRRFYQQLARDSQMVEFLRTHPTTQAHNGDGWANRCAEFVALVPDRRLA